MGYSNGLGVDFNGDPSSLQPTDNPNPVGGAYVTAPDYAQLMLMQLGAYLVVESTTTIGQGLAVLLYEPVEAAVLAAG